MVSLAFMKQLTLAFVFLLPITSYSYFGSAEEAAAGDMRYLPQVMGSIEGYLRRFEQQNQISGVERVIILRAYSTLLSLTLHDAQEAARQAAALAAHEANMPAAEASRLVRSASSHSDLNKARLQLKTLVSALPPLKTKTKRPRHNDEIDLAHDASGADAMMTAQTAAYEQAKASLARGDGLIGATMCAYRAAQWVMLNELALHFGRRFSSLFSDALTQVPRPNSSQILDTEKSTARFLNLHLIGRKSPEMAFLLPLLRTIGTGKNQKAIFEFLKGTHRESSMVSRAPLEIIQHIVSYVPMN